MQWPPEQIWNGKDVFILGGGPSVRHFPILRLIEEKVIGCNHAYLFGPTIVDILLFGDMKFYQAHKDRKAFRKFPNPIMTNCMKEVFPDRIIRAPRQLIGFHKKALGWNGNVGSSAINLALLLGAQRVLLIGFDMEMVEGKQNWHEEIVSPIEEENYLNYIRAFDETAYQIFEKWPGVEILNLNPNSKLNVFPKYHWKDVLH